MEGLVEPAVRAVAVPILMRTLFQGDRGGIVKTDNERSGLDGFEGRFVDIRGGNEAFVDLWCLSVTYKFRPHNPPPKKKLQPGIQEGNTHTSVHTSLFCEVRIPTGALLSAFS